MMHYLVLAVLTLAIAYAAWLIWKASKEPGFIIGIGLIYYWTLLGAWFLIYDDLSGGKGVDFGLSYYIYTEILFPVHADGSYLLTLLSYGSFILLIEAVILFVLRRRSVSKEVESSPVLIHHGWLMTGCLAALMISFSLEWKQILTAAKFGHSIYVVTRQQPGTWYTIHQLLNQAAVSGIFLGFLIFLSGDGAKLIKGVQNKKGLFFVYIPAVLLIVGFMLLLGNKKELMTAGILGVIFFYANNGRRWRPAVIGLFSLIIIIPFIFNNGMRAYSPTFLVKYFNTSHLEFALKKEIHYTKFTISSSALSFLFSNEMFCAHMSMYGVISRDAPLTYGSSLKSLGASIVPKALWPDRPAPIYIYYADYFKLPEGQGFTIHHATGWYLNFGYVGIVLGALLAGWLWAITFLGRFRAQLSKWKWLNFVYILAFAGFISLIPSLIRSGPEAYKMVVFEGIILPALILYLSSLFVRKNRKA